MRDLLLFNPLPWERTVRGPVGRYVRSPRGVAADPTAGRHSQDRGGEGWGVVAALDGRDAPLPPGAAYLPATAVPGYGYATVETDDLDDPAEWDFDERATVETDRYRLAFDRERGGVASWRDRERDREWVDGGADWPLAGFVHERVADAERDDPRHALFSFPTDEALTSMGGLGDAGRGWQTDWHAERTGPTGVRRHRVYDLPDGHLVRQRLATDAVGDVELAVFCPAAGATLTVEAAWRMGRRTRPESTYLAFPFDVDDPTPRVDVGGQAAVPGEDQLPGSCHDYYTAQRWVDLSGAEGGVTVGTPLAPLVQFGGFHFADDQRTVDLEDAHLYGWVTNNYWETNFRAHQPGVVRARYHLTPHGGFDEARAHRLGGEAAHHEPLAQHVGEPAAEPGLEATASLLDLPEPPVLVEQLRPADAPGLQARYRDLGDGADEGGAFALLANAADEPTTASVRPGALAVGAAERVPLLGGEGAPLPVDEGSVALELEPRERAAVRLRLE